MRTLSLILTICITVISGSVMAQNDTYACQYIKTAGLSWKNGKWNSDSFINDDPFFLSAINNKLTSASVSKIFDGTEVNCFEKVTVSDSQTCATRFAELLIFNFKTMNGGVSNIYGSQVQSNQQRKDTLSVGAFTCTKM